MGRQSAHVAKVVWGFNDAAAKMVMPDTVNDGATREHVVGFRDPSRQGGAAETFIVCVGNPESRGRPGDGWDRSGLHQLAWPPDIAARQEMDGVGGFSGTELIVGREVISSGIDFFWRRQGGDFAV